VRNSTFEGNSADQAPGLGGALYTESGGSVHVVAATLSGNSAQVGGGGNLASAAGSSLVIRQSIVVAGLPTNCAGPITSEGANLESGAGCGFAVAGDVTGASAALGPLADHGGPTLTRLPGAGGAAIDAVGPAACSDGEGGQLARDQRGQPRPRDGNGDGVSRCDIGAAEDQPTAGLPTPTVRPIATPCIASSRCSYLPLLGK
jgi:hypothetical protein